MKKNHILVTGGAGFIGSFLVDRLIEMGHRVRILDCLESQVHHGVIPFYIPKKAVFIRGNVQKKSAVRGALSDIDVVYHLAARVGVAQSNYEIAPYIDTNIRGMANILDAIVTQKFPVKKIIMTASMTSYGEGSCICDRCGIVKPNLRNEDQLAQTDWNLYCPTCGRLVRSTPTNEDAAIHNNSIYSLTKNVQEEMMHFIGKLYRIPTVSLRCFNVYGPRQSLSNPYTGVAAIFISRLKHNHAPVVYEDGKQSRDFISVHDVVHALIASMERDQANYERINIGSGVSTNIEDLAVLLATLLKKNIHPYISGAFRKNDIRQCCADIFKAKKLLNWRPTISLEKGLSELVAWAENEPSFDLFDTAVIELKKHRLSAGA